MKRKKQLSSIIDEKKYYFILILAFLLLLFSYNFKTFNNQKKTNDKLNYFIIANNIKLVLSNLFNECALPKNFLNQHIFYLNNNYVNFKKDSLKIVKQMNLLLSANKDLNSINCYRSKKSFINTNYINQKPKNRILSVINKKHPKCALEKHEIQKILYKISNSYITTPFFYVREKKTNNLFENKTYLVYPRFNSNNDLLSLIAVGIELEEILNKQRFHYFRKGVVSIRISNYYGLILASTDNIYNNNIYSPPLVEKKHQENLLENILVKENNYNILYTTIELKNEMKKLQLQLRFINNKSPLSSINFLYLALKDPINYLFIFIIIIILIILKIRNKYLQNFEIIEKIFLNFTKAGNPLNALNHTQEVYQLKKEYHNIILKIMNKISNTENTLKDFFNDKVFIVEKDIYFYDIISKLKKHNNYLMNSYKNLLTKQIDEEDLEIIPKSLINLKQKIEKILTINNDYLWQNKAISKLHQVLNGTDIKTLSNTTCSFFAELLSAEIVTLYVYNKSIDTFILSGSYGFNIRPSIQNKIKINEGIIGQAIAEKKMISVSDASNFFHYIKTSYITIEPKNITAVPILKDDTILGILEIVTINQPDKQKIDFIKNAVKSISDALQTALDHKEINNLLQLTQEKSKELEVTQKEIEDKNITLTIAKQDLEKKAGELEKSNQYKTDFLANVSHELRTPLNSLMLLAQNLLNNNNENLLNEQIDDISIIYKNGQDLLHLINDVLDLSKIESGKMDVYFEEINIYELTGKVQSEFKSLVKQKNINLFLNINNNFPGIIYTDYQKTEQILKNLISNAFKFTSKGSIIVDFDYYKDSSMVDDRFNFINPKDIGRIPKYPFYVISVKDTGIGIPLEKQDLIFNAFRQADSTTSRIYGGTGLGLAISKQFIELLDGLITLQSRENIGTTFYVFIPDKTLVANMNNLNLNNNISAKTSNDLLYSNFNNKNSSDKNYKSIFKNKSVLIVDNNMRNLYALSKTLQDYGLIVHKAPDGSKSLDIFKNKSNTIDIVILDLTIAEMNDCETLKKMKKIKDIPVLILLPNNLQKSRKKCLVLGATDFITKPIDLAKLLSSLKTWIN